MRIGELAQQTGATTKAIRYYESLGLLPRADRTQSGYRDYGFDAIERVRFIKDAQAGGLTLREIQSLVELSGLTQAAVDGFFFSNARKVCVEVDAPHCGGCVAAPVCAQRTDLFQPIIRTTAY